MPAPYVLLGMAVAAVAVSISLALWMELGRRTAVPVSSRTRRRPRETEYSPEPVTETDKCLICCDNKISVQFLPCLHCCLCSECKDEYLSMYKVCPLCRSGIQESVELNL